MIINDGKNDGVHKCNHVLGPVGGDAQQNIGAEHVEQKYDVKEAGKVEHGCGCGCGCGCVCGYIFI